MSSITELAKRWAPSIYNNRPKGAKAHRALADARESIEYLRYYQTCGFIGGETEGGSIQLSSTLKFVLVFRFKT